MILELRSLVTPI